MKTTAAVLVETGRPLEVVELTLPEKLSFGQVLVELSFSGICGAQLNEIDGAKGPDKFLPHLLGHEGSGTVLEVGEGVRTVKVGDHVVLHWRPSAGLQCDPPKYLWGSRTVNAGWVTTFNKHAVVSENRLTVIPSDFDMTLAPLFGCALTTATGVINNDAQVKIGQSVVIFGVGGVGQSVCQIARMVSANPIIAVDLKEEKFARAKEWGATHGLASGNGADVPTAVREILDGDLADVVIDTTGNPRVIEMAYDLTAADGKTILVGVPRKGEKVNIYTLPLHFEKVLTGSHGGSIQPDREIPRLIRLVRTGVLKLDGLITHQFPLAEINQAIAAVRNENVGRVIIRM